MTDPHPEARRRQRLDRADHGRAARNRGRGGRGPSERHISKALKAVAKHDVPGTPKVGTLKVLREIHESERTTDTRTVRDFSITRGDPQHGAHRSDDHIGRYEVELPIEEVEDEVTHGDTCPECGGERALYKYHAHHYIAGGESLLCLQCEELLHSEEWG